MSDTEYQAVEGIDHLGTGLWTARLIRESAGSHWLGTGRDELFVMQLDLPATLSFFIRAYPGTSGIRIYGTRAAGSQRYEYVDLSEATHKLVIDGIMEKIGEAG